MKKETAFTLSEVLITLVVIGVVAAITVPMLLHQEGERVNSERHANIVYKIAQATDLMKTQGALNKFATTDEFVDELQKYLKINKRCDSNHLDECWTTSKVKTMSGEEYEVKNAKTRKDLLGEEINHPDNSNVGIVLADGANIILTYNPDSDSMSQGDEVIHTAGLLPVGDGKEEFWNFTSNTMNGLAFVFDVNGNRGPNAEQQNSIMKDIRSYNEARFYTEAEFNNPCDKYTATNKFRVGKTCYFELSSKYTWYSAQTACQSVVPGSKQVGATEDGGYSTLVSTCEAIKAKNGNNTTAPFTAGNFWSATQIYDCGYLVTFPSCKPSYASYCPTGGNDRYASYFVLCAGN